MTHWERPPEYDDPPDPPEEPMFETAMFYDLLEMFCKRAHQNSLDKGFWGPLYKHDNGEMTPQNKPNYGEKYMLLVSEIAELFEAHRKGTLEKPCDKDATILDPTSTEPCTYRCEMCVGKGTILTSESYTPTNKQSISTLTFPVDCPSCAGTGSHTSTGVRRLTNEEEEVADIAIRLGDYCGYRKIDLGNVILAKMRYNTTRPHMHNKSC